MLRTKPKVLRPVHANRGIEARYRKQLLKIVDDMHNSVGYWIPAAYRKEPPRTLATVKQTKGAGTPFDKILKRFKKLSDQWVTRFEDAAPEIAKSYVSDMFKASDSSFRAALKDAGVAVEFKMTPPMRDAFRASLAENVSLIRSIPQQYLTQVEGVVARSYASGRDLETMVKELKQLYPKASHRAELIARDQSNKANAVVNRTRQLELGITQAVWMHSNAGKTPRQSHLAANGKKFEVAQGMLIDGKYIQPGEDINCRCTSRAVLPV